MNLSTKRRSATALAGGVALAAFGLFAVGVPASADPGSGGNGTITIHKYEQPIGDLGSADGSEITSITATPLAGVVFTICEVSGLDLSSASDWGELDKLVLTDNGTARPGLTYTGSKVPAPTLVNCLGLSGTDLNGVAAVSKAADKAYVVYESGPLQNTVTTAQPFIITVPFPGNGAGGQPVWNYNPHVYPKNGLANSGATKNATVIGNKVTYEIKVPVNPLGTGKTYSQFDIKDTLTAGLTYTSSSVTLTNGGGNLLSAGDYSLSHTAGSVNFAMLTSGLQKLDNNIGGMVTLTINVDATTASNTSNSATISINGKDADVVIITPKQFYAGNYVMKNAQNKGAAGVTPLTGATFMVYSKVNAEVIATCPATQAAAAADATLSQVNTGTAPFTSAANGMTPTVTLMAGDYCVYETGVPAGYKGDPTGQKLTVNAANSYVTFLNSQFGATAGDLPGLPITGAQGQVLMLIADIALVSIGGGLYLVRRHRA